MVDWAPFFGDLMIIEASAPTRVDLAGGTIDIWPLYLFHRRAVTVNFAIDLLARCRLIKRDDRRILLKSQDTKEEIEFEDLNSLRSSSKLRLLAKLVDFFSPENGLELVTDCTSPAGAGLAGSSALNIAICGALNCFTGAGYGLDDLIRIAKNVEAQVIGVPTGDQDYYPAAYGGLQALHLTAGGIIREEVSVDLDRLAERLILIYSGVPRDSGINNWRVMKRHIDGDEDVFQAFEGILVGANDMLSALRSGNLDSIGEALELEWSHRRTLSEGIATSQINRLISKARSFGAGSGKVCGAGGGGCLLCRKESG
jgi:D-glycero-alpha-D-manno-heptose-7-phosphate kinase